MRHTPSLLMRNTATCFLACALGATARAETKITRDNEYARAGEISLKLDLHVPDGEKKPWLIVYVHGGAWRGGTKDNIPLGGLVARSYPMASVEYRLSTV